MGLTPAQLAANGLTTSRRSGNGGKPSSQAWLNSESKRVAPNWGEHHEGLLLYRLLSVGVGCSGAVEACKPSKYRIPVFWIDKAGLGINDEDYLSGCWLAACICGAACGCTEGRHRARNYFCPVPVKDRKWLPQVSYGGNGEIAWIADNAVRPMRRADGTTGGCTLGGVRMENHVQSSSILALASVTKEKARRPIQGRRANLVGPDT